MLSLSSLGTLFFRGGLVRKVVTGYSGDTFPNFTPNPIFATAYRSGDGRSRALVVPRVLAAPRGGGPWAPGGHHALDRGVVDGGRTTRTRGSTRRSGRLVCSRRSCPTSTLLHAPVADRAGNVAVHPPLLEGVWGALAATRGRDRHGRAGRRRPASRGRISCASPRTACSRCAKRRSAPTRAASTPAISPSTATARTTSSGSRRAPRRGATTSTTGSATGCSRSTIRTNTSPRLGAERIDALRAKAEPDSWRTDEARVPAGCRRASQPLGAGRDRGARGIWRSGCIALGADAVLAGAGVANLAAWLAVAQRAGAGQRRGADRRDRPVGLRPDPR